MAMALGRPTIMRVNLKRLRACHETRRYYVTGGGLVSYGFDIVDQYRRKDAARRHSFDFFD
jgi:hypothetical protein